MFIVLVCLLSAVDNLSAIIYDGDLLMMAEQRFSTELLQTIAANTNYTKDVFFSPYSIYSSMLTVYIASAGNTEKSFEKFLRFDPSYGLPSKRFIIDKFLLNPPEFKSEYTLTSLDRIYYSPDFKVKKDKQSQFGEKIAVFKTENDREDEINKWVSENTKGIIQHFLNKGTIKPGPTIAFVNAAYFKGNWVYPLTGGTSKKPFTLPDGTVTETLFMSLNDRYYKIVTDQELKAQIISLPYKGGEISMIIILPTTKPQKNASPPLADVVKKLTGTKITKISFELKYQKECLVDLLIPKFKSEEKYQLKPIFESLGDKELFTQALNLTNLFEPGTTTNVDNIVHQATVNVYENGTEASAATATILVGSTGDEDCTTTFQADHPFVYIIFDHERFAIHYIGILNTPKHT